MKKASFFVAVLFDCSFRDTELLIQSLRVDRSSLKQDTGQGSNFKFQATEIEEVAYVKKTIATRGTHVLYSSW